MDKSSENKTYTDEAKKKALMYLEKFVREDDSAKYVIDPKNVLCRTKDDAVKVSCVKLNELDEKEIFAHMQNLGFYCALSQDPNQFGIEYTDFYQIINAKHQTILHTAFLKLIDKILEQVPPNSNFQNWDVYSGTAGLSLLFMKIHECDPGVMFGSKSALTIADEYIDTALSTHMKLHNTPSEAGLPGLIEQECGFLTTAVGLYTVAAHVKHHTGDHESSHRYLNLIQSHFSKSALSIKTPSELLYGRAGYLYAERLMSGLIDPKKEPPTSQIVSSVIESIIEDGKRTAINRNATDYTPLFWTWQDLPYVGAAHGFAGILTMLLQFPEQCQEHLGLIKNTTDFILFKSRQEDGNWPYILFEPNNNLVQFCHGAPGIFFLACYVYLHGKTRKGVGLCHGVAGNAYPFLSVYILTKDHKYLRNALEYAEICAQWEEKTEQGEFSNTDKPWSVFEGIGGAIWLISDLLYWDQEIFKGFPGLTDI
ncbi:4884_t:CDS:2 [Funneliformis geosporum]|uniref:11530_t:CDS:1 n=1 Tax=Funneliformis geosporum TaxID=1117311 RepID=A0A9W4SJP7_9GLOM|nr:4884_t:CDS:2 [Funneliformis geosporum]CAI2172006.1 11530_t:CDS:2 [Funneliformis geosporum]